MLTTNLNREKLFRRLRYFKPSAEFRDKFQYSNIGYTVAGILVEQLTGMKWEEFLTERIFQPLGMKRTSFLAHESLSLTDQEAISSTHDLIDPAGPIVSAFSKARLPLNGIVVTSSPTTR